MATEGAMTHDTRGYAGGSYMPTDPGRFGGGTYTSQDVEPTIEAYENIFGPSARDIKQDLQRFKRHGRWHLPDILKGPNQYLTDRVDGLITDATNSPFTSKILPYEYITNVDGKIKWNVWSFDEGLASRVPYESAARTLTQSKRSFSGYTVRQGMAIVLEHNFMMTDAGRTNFQNQLNQLIGSIQQTNDLDVHVALVLAPSYAKTIREKYISDEKTSTQICRQFVDLFGFMQKNTNALDILIEEAKAELRTWGGPLPDFMLCNSKLTFNMTMTPDVTNYVTQGPEGPKRLKAGPNLQSYRGIGIVHTRSFSMETGAPPRDILRRRVRVAEYYHIPQSRENFMRSFQLYNEERDTWFTLSFRDLLRHAYIEDGRIVNPNLPGRDNARHIQQALQALDNQQSGAVVHTTTTFLGGNARAVGLGAAITGADADDDAGGVLAFFTKAFKSPGLDYVGPYTFIGRNIVYVPGAMDAFEPGVYQLIIAPNLKGLMLQAWEKAGPDRIHFGGTPDQAVACVSQSVAKYPRNIYYVLTKMEAYNVALVNTPRVMPDSGHIAWYPYQNPAVGGAVVLNFDPGAVGTATGGLGIPNEIKCRRFLSALALRNYNRYGIPIELCFDANKILEAGRSSMMAVFDIANIGLHVVDTPYQVVLRPIGAFFCPNHYKTENNREYVDVGDHYGHSLLLTNELLTAFTRVKAGAVAAGDMGGMEGFGRTLLFDVISNFDRYPVLLAAVENILKAMQTFAVAGRAVRRWELTAAFHADLLAAIDGANPAAGGPFPGAGVHETHGLFWTWPRTEASTEDIFDANNLSELAVAVKARPVQVELDMDLVQHMAGGAGHAPGGAYGPGVADGGALGNFVATRAGPGHLADSRAARNFLNMLAWRMWADQEFPAPATVNQRYSNWPEPMKFLRPGDKYHGRGFGGGLIETVHAPGQLTNAELTEDIEVLIVRPNIEHYMMGIILGQGGKGLGSTFWGQTELSCYDDSMHGIWGMSYKYNERAIVINERNLIRLWDVAYDSYVGGKGDVAVDWTLDDSKLAFHEATGDVTKHYRGASMMVMAFSHVERKEARFRDMYESDLKPNMPSPLVFCDDMQPGPGRNVASDFDNLHVVQSQEFRVFHKDIYRNAYSAYKAAMPDFTTLHSIRKNAGQSSVENEVSSDSLAFQGSMKILNAAGARIAEIDGSGHHGPDFTGVASLRSGKGYRINSQPTVQRLV